ncbi:hypothetical protein ACFLYI_03020 [Chloroflexota bacterium]
MKEIIYYENYPLWIVVLTNIVSFTIYGTGAFVIYKIGWIWPILYIPYIAWLELRLLKRSCVNCNYYGKVCAFGKGKLSSLFFKKGDTNRFKQDKITWKDMIPDIMVSLIPIVAGVILLVIDFNWLILSIVLLLLLLSSLGNGLIRGSLACKYCKQREIGCPAEQLFSRDKAKA